MNTPRKFWLVLIGAVLTMAAIACSCSSILPTPTASPPPNVVPLPAVPSEPMPGLAGKWLDPDTSGTYHVIAWQNGEYVVMETRNPDRGGNEVTSSTWANNVLTWTYCVPDGACVTTETVSVSGDSLYTNWSNDQGYSGSTTMQRMP